MVIGLGLAVKLGLAVLTVIVILWLRRPVLRQ